MLRIIDRKIEQELQQLLDRSGFSLERPETKVVQEIIREVRKNGDRALKEYTKKLDGVTLEQIKVDSWK